MTRNRKRKTNKGSFSEEMMRSAVNLVTLEGFSIRQAAERPGIKFSTLQRYVSKEKAKAEQEQSLTDYIIQCSVMCYGKSIRDLIGIAYEMADINKIQVPHNWDRDKKAGLEL